MDDKFEEIIREDEAIGFLPKEYRDYDTIWMTRPHVPKPNCWRDD